jgi:fructosamine-3-kinase
MSARAAWQDAVIATLAASPRALAGDDRSVRWKRVGGNAIAASWSLSLEGTRFFVKVTDRAYMNALSAESDALGAIARTGSVRVPTVHACGEAPDGAFLAIEWLDLADGGRGAALGRALARLHQTTAPRFGWHRDNTIGATPQSNAWSDDWTAFFRDRRLAPQFALARRNGFAGRLARDGDRLLDRMPRLLAGHAPAASLLHGDLWSGNAARLADGTPVVFDPSCHFGDREADLAMTELFGGFDATFYAAYAEASPLPHGYPVRRTLYQLYHVLNHLNLFGSGYLARAETRTAQLLAEAG